MYGTAPMGGLNGDGVVYELSPSGSGWSERTIHDFSGSDGIFPQAGLIFDGSGNLYGAAAGGGSQQGGNVYRLTPSSNGQWTETVLYMFSGADGNYPVAQLTFDAVGSLYGTTLFGGAHNEGVAFKLTPSAGTWSYSRLHDFTAPGNGQNPYGKVVVDAAGNVYGTTVSGGAEDSGVVWEITP